MGCGASASPPYKGETVIEEPEDVTGAWKPPEPAVAVVEAPGALPKAAAERDSDGDEPSTAGRKSHSARPCREFAKGHCKFGDRCKYSHDIEGRKSVPSHRTCKEFLKGNCKYGDKCKYSHEMSRSPRGSPEGDNDAEAEADDSRRRLTAVDGRKSPTPCREFAKGFCKFGDSCRFSHDEAAFAGGKPLVLDPEATSLVVPMEELDYDDAVKMLEETKSSIQKNSALRDACKELVPEIQALEAEERTASEGVLWQFRGKRREANFFDFSTEDSAKLEVAYQAWVDSGKSKKHVDRRYELEIQPEHGGRSTKIMVDFHLMTQKAMHKGGAVRVVRRHVLPSKAQKQCRGYFDDVISLVGDVSGKIEKVNGKRAGMGLTSDESKELTNLEMACIDVLRPIVNGFIELAVLCNAGELLEKLTAVLGPANASRLGVEASGRKMRLQAVCKVVKAAFETRSYRKLANAEENPWQRVRPLVFSPHRFYDMSLLRIREHMIKYREDSTGTSRRHAFMMAGMLLNDADDEPDFQRQCKHDLSNLLQQGLELAMEGGGDFEAIRSILNNAKGLELRDFRPMVATWLTARLQSSISSNQPVQWTAQLMQKMRELGGFDGGKVAAPLMGELTQKCAKGILDGSIPPEQVNQIAVFHGILGSDFDEALFEALQEEHEDPAQRPLIVEWLVAYCEHTGADMPSYCMNADQQEAYDNLCEAMESGDHASIKAALIAAKLVPDLKAHEELEAQFMKALEILKREARLPPGWDLEDLLGTEKLFKKEQITDRDQLALFQELLDATHQKRWTRDRATRGDGEKIADRFEVVHVTEIQNQASWENYDKRRQEIIGACCPRGRAPFAPISNDQWNKWSGGVMTRELGEKISKQCQLSPLEARCNEFLFFHGAKPLVADLIAENHFDISYASKDGMFGAGLYFAEASSKSDEYVVPNDKHEFPLIIVRVTLGKVNYCDKPKPFDDPGRRALEHSCTSGAYHSVLGDRIKVSGTYREYVVYDHFQAYPHFILWYKRV